ncbi:MAG: hypothetical protein IJH34_15885 [Romboutsia sp.]|nr:hypothetical protein [Romboutsia sp.]
MRHYIMNITFKVGIGELRDSRIKRIEEIFDEFNLQYEKENYDEIEVIYYFPKMSTNYESFEKLIEARKKLIEYNLTVNCHSPKGK